MVHAIHNSCVNCVDNIRLFILLFVCVILFVSATHKLSHTHIVQIILQIYFNRNCWLFFCCCYCVCVCVYCIYWSCVRIYTSGPRRAFFLTFHWLFIWYFWTSIIGKAQRHHSHGGACYVHTSQQMERPMFLTFNVVYIIFNSILAQVFDCRMDPIILLIFFFVFDAFILWWQQSWPYLKYHFLDVFV